jgi:hypothetical protein
VPGKSDTFTGFLGDPLLNGAGEVAFVGDLSRTSDGLPNEGVFKESDGILTAVALPGDPVLGTSATFRAFRFLVMNEAGDTAFWVDFTMIFEPKGVVKAVVKESGGTLTAVALQGDPAPGTGGTFSFPLTSGGPVINGAGDTAFIASIDPVSTVGRGVFKESGGTLTAVALQGDPVLGTNDRFGQSLTGAVINGAGEVAFVGSFVGAPDEQGIFKESGGTLTAVALPGDPAPGTSTTFRNFVGFPVINGAGEVAFVGNFGTPDDEGVFKESGGTLTAIALPGDPAPDTGGATFTDFGGLVLNGAGEVAFTGNLSSGGTGAFVYHPLTAQVEKVLADGDMPKVAPGDAREVNTVLLLGPSGNQDGRQSGFNDGGQAALRVTFTDGSEAIVRATPVPLERLIAAVEAAGLRSGIENSLTKKLRNAQGSLTRGQINGAIGKIEAFISEVEAQRGKKIPEADADAWIADAQAIIDAFRIA